jgi:hypothetical protein
VGGSGVELAQPLGAWSAIASFGNLSTAA